MATKKHITTKSLKAKAPRKQAKPAKRERQYFMTTVAESDPDCPVEKLGRDQDKLIAHHGRLKNAIPTLKDRAKTNAEEALRLVEDKMIANRSAASYLVPKSGLGAGFRCLTGSTMAPFPHLAHRTRYLDAAILLAAVRRAVRGNRISLTPSLGTDKPRLYALRDHILHHGGESILIQDGCGVPRSVA
jgi:hypothetical protein